MTSNWSEIPLEPDDERELSGRVRFRSSSRSTSESKIIDIEHNVDLTQTESQAKNNEEAQTSHTKRLHNSYAYQLGKMFVHGAAKVVSNVAGGGQQNRDAIKQLRAELDDSRLKCDKLERDVENARQWLAYYENINGGLQNQIEENKQKHSLEQQSMREKLLKSEKDAESCRDSLAEVTKMKDAMEEDVTKLKITVARMKKQVEDAQKKLGKFQEAPVTLSQPNVALTSTSTQVHGFNPLEASSIPPHEQLLVKSNNKENQLKDVATTMQVLISQRDTLRHQLMASLESMKSQTIEMRRSKAALNSAMSELTSLTAIVDEEKQKNEKLESQIFEQRKVQSEINEILDWHCKHQVRIIQELRSKNLELRRSIEKQSAYFGKSFNSAYYQASNADAQFHQPTCYASDQNKTFLPQESTNRKPAEIKKENEERSFGSFQIFPVARSADAAISERRYVQSTDKNVGCETERHHFVTYNGVQFDLASLSISEILNIAFTSEAISSQKRMNNFYLFLAKRIEEMEKNCGWEGVHNLGSPSVWLSLQKKEE